MSPIPRGMIDCHLHHGPDAIPQKATPVELAYAAGAVGTEGVVAARTLFGLPGKG